MVKIYVIDNGGQWTHREWRTLKYLDVETKIIPNTAPFNEIHKENIDGLVLSGGAPRVGIKDTLGNCAEYLEQSTIPLLGICAGHITAVPQHHQKFLNSAASLSHLLKKLILFLKTSQQNPLSGNPIMTKSQNYHHNSPTLPKAKTAPYKPCITLTKTTMASNFIQK